MKFPDLLDSGTCRLEGLCRCNAHRGRLCDSSLHVREEVGLIHSPSLHVRPTSESIQSKNGRCFRCDAVRRLNVEINKSVATSGFARCVFGPQEPYRTLVSQECGALARGARLIVKSRSSTGLPKPAISSTLNDFCANRKISQIIALRVELIW